MLLTFWTKTMKHISSCIANLNSIITDRTFPEHIPIPMEQAGIVQLRTAIHFLQLARASFAIADAIMGEPTPKTEEAA